MERKPIRKGVAVASTVGLFFILVISMVAGAFVNAYASYGNEGFQNSFNLEKCDFSSTGSNSYFFLEPGYQLTLEGEDEGATVQLVVTVLNETKMVDGIETRIVEERETEDGELVEISRNYFSICAPGNDIFYFGEEVDIYEDGKLAGHEGAWLAGEDNAKPGIIVPSDPRVGMKYYQEIAPGVAEDRAEIISLGEVVTTPAGTFENVIKVEETTPLEPGVKEFKFHAAGIGLIQDAELKLVKYVLPEKDDEAEEPKATDHSYPLTVDGNQYVIKYVAKGGDVTIQTMTIDKDAKSLISALGVGHGLGTITIEIPRNVIEAKDAGDLDAPYSVLVDGTAANFTEIESNDTTRVLEINVGGEAKQIVISGTHVVPEFGLSVVVAGAGIVAAVIASRNIARRFNNHGFATST